MNNQLTSPPSTLNFTTVSLDGESLPSLANDCMRDTIFPIPIQSIPKAPYYEISGVLDNKECDEVVKYAQQRAVYGERDGGRMWAGDVLPKEAPHIYSRLTRHFVESNIWDLSLTGVTEPFRVLGYAVGASRGVHIDYDVNGIDRSKISLIIGLVDESDYEGGLLNVGAEAIKIQKGQAIFFPSFLPHSVDPILKGERVVLAGWVSGPALR